MLKINNMFVFQCLFDLWTTCSICMIVFSFCRSNTSIYIYMSIYIYIYKCGAWCDKLLLHCIFKFILLDRFAHAISISDSSVVSNSNHICKVCQAQSSC